MSGEPENLVLQLLRGLRSDMADMRSDIARLDAKLDETRVEFKAELRSEINSLRADVASDLLTMQKPITQQIANLRKETGEQIAGLRQTVVEYHPAVIGHGFLIGDLARMRRVERHLDLPPLVAGRDRRRAARNSPRRGAPHHRQQPAQQRLRARRATGNEEIDRQHVCDAADDRV
jgi:hypothetical protein